MHFATDTVADIILDNTEMGAAEDGFDGVADVADMGAWADFVDSGPEASLGGFYHVLYGGIGAADNGSKGGVGVPTFVFNDEVERDFVAIFEFVVGIGGAMDELIVYGNTDGTREGRVG